VNSAFFQILGVAGLIVAFLCIFFLDEPQGSFADFHEGEETTEPMPPIEPSIPYVREEQI